MLPPGLPPQSKAPHPAPNLDTAAIAGNKMEEVQLPARGSPTSGGELPQIRYPSEPFEPLGNIWAPAFRFRRRRRGRSFRVRGTARCSRRCSQAAGRSSGESAPPNRTPPPAPGWAGAWRKEGGRCVGCGRGRVGLGAGGSRLWSRRAGRRGPWGAVGLGLLWDGGAGRLRGRAPATEGDVPCPCPCRLLDTPVLVPSRRVRSVGLLGSA